MKRIVRNFHWYLLALLIIATACTSAAQPLDEASALVTASPAINPTPTQLLKTPTEEIDVDLPAGITLEFWHPWTGEMADLFQEITAEFNRTNTWGIEVVFEGHADESVFLDDISQAQAAGELPDVIAAPSQILKLWYQQGIPLRDLSEFINAEEGGLSQEQLNSLFPIFWKSDLDSDVRLGIPVYRSGHFLFYNQSWANDLGFTEIPGTSADFSQQSCAAAQANLAVANGTGGWFYDSGAFTTLSWMQAFSGTSILNTGREVEFQNEGNQMALEYLYDLFMQDCAWIGQQSTPYQYFAQRYALFYSGTSEDVFVQEAANLDGENLDDWMLIPYPSDEYRPVVYVDGFSAGILGSDEDQSLAAWLFLRYLLDTENQTKVVESTGALPISNAAINSLSEFRQDHPAWDSALQYIALAQSAPLNARWVQVKPVLADMAWQLRQYNTKREDIPTLLTEAGLIIQSMDEN